MVPNDLAGTRARKIRQLLEEHLEVTGRKSVVKLRHITDPDFWHDFDSDPPARELRQAVTDFGPGEPLDGVSREDFGERRRPVVEGWTL